MFYGVEQFRSKKCDSLSLGPGSVLGRKGKKRGKIGKITGERSGCCFSFFPRAWSQASDMFSAVCVKERINHKQR